MRRDGTDLNESERQKTPACEVKERMWEGKNRERGGETQAQNKTEGGKKSERERERERKNGDDAVWYLGTKKWEGRVKEEDEETERTRKMIMREREWK